MSKCECCKEENSDLITYKGYKMCPACYMGYVRKVKVCENNAKYETEIDQLKQQLAEKDKEINYLIVDYEKRISQEQELMSNMEHRLTEKQNMIDEINKEFVQAVHDWKTLCAEKDTRIAELEDKDWYEACIEQLEEQNNRLIDTLKEKDKEIEELKKWQEWYSIWHENFKKQIEDLTTELETYRPTKLHGNGQCKCFNCNAINWTDWCSQYKGHIYCNKCLKDILKEEQTSQTQLAIQELEKVKTLIQNVINFEKPDFVGVYDAINKQINVLKGEKDVKD